jgi:hypothetical protein
MQAVDIVQGCCDIKINWQVPANDPENNLEVIQYNLVIKGQDGQFYNSQQNNCGRKGTDSSCTVHNSHLVRPPFNLPRGHVVIAKIQALNPAGWGPFSPSNVGATTVANVQPGTPGSLSIQSTTDHSATIQWTDALGATIDVSKEWYQMQVNTGANGEFIALKDKLGINSYTADGLIPGKVYKFRVRSINCCGMSAFSKVLVVTVWRKPDRPVLNCPVSKCTEMVEMAWTLPNSYDSPILEQELSIQDNNGKPQTY